MFRYLKYILLGLFSVIFIFSCKKTNESSSPQDIIGVWKLVKTYCDCPLPPLIADSVGILDIVTFNINKTWTRVQNSITIDSGFYSTGHNEYTPYVGAFTFIYDSVSYFKKGINVGSDYYQIRSSDTLIFGAGIAGRFSSYSLPYNGSMWFIKQ